MLQHKTVKKYRTNVYLQHKIETHVTAMATSRHENYHQTKGRPCMIN